ncbi:hypothetical protein SAMN04488518_103101 [Pseudovibrio ascidiaceicola]|uniref:Uncharacterized protein n=1 Tax=Pseudovibrio ascidiaceicola TaxID=285279 RepID=A0A1I3XR59_9HYPH|nr:hypothetical protein [Pseudovibrio ascidiaceicola]SFK22020.1 hypothetical protein SAMN04488518_103101 [Pseudovibrio ascidiaceicola]
MTGKDKDKAPPPPPPPPERVIREGWTPERKPVEKDLEDDR